MNQNVDTNDSKNLKLEIQIFFIGIQDNFINLLACNEQQNTNYRSVSQYTAK